MSLLCRPVVGACLPDAQDSTPNSVLCQGLVFVELNLIRGALSVLAAPPVNAEP